MEPNHTEQQEGIEELGARKKRPPPINEVSQTSSRLSPVNIQPHSDTYHRPTTSFKV
jgi:hypothetical protein